MEVSAQQDLAPEKMGNVEDWTREELLEVPQQKNGTDCGIFALLFARFAVSRRSPDFEQGHIPYYRRRICYDIVDPITNGTENGQT
jgi:Ulp1 family protease